MVGLDSSEPRRGFVQAHKVQGRVSLEGWQWSENVFNKMRLVDSDTPKVMKCPFPFMTRALFPSFGAAFSNTPRTRMLSLCKLRTSMKSWLCSLS